MSKKTFKNSQKNKPEPSATGGEYSAAALYREPSAFVRFLEQVLPWGLGLLCVLISVCFYTGTYDTAFVKITLLQMGGITLVALWLGLLAVQKRFPITRENLPWLLPFLVYFGWNFLGYTLTPYKMEAFEEFLRYVLYFCLSLMILDRFSVKAVRTLTKYIIVAAWISCLYGLVQVLDRWLPGIDIMPWRRFFGMQVFSTHANPNFFGDFVVFSSCIVAAEYFRTKSKRLLLLLGIALVDLFCTESKGAWLGFAASGTFFAALYTNRVADVKKYSRKLLAGAAVLLLGVGVLVGIYAAKRFQSVSFRAYTWASVLDMVQASPVMGTGVGSFKLIYPAYRRPQIFYIENMHNNETQHAENEYLEQWATAGTVGLAIFLWLIFFVLYTSWRGLKTKRGCFDDRAWWTLGYAAAFFGICVHNFFDISMRFVSTGLFFAIFAALLVRLNMLEQSAEDTPLPPPSKFWLLQISRTALLLAVLWLVGFCIYFFAQISSNVSSLGIGSVTVKVCSWMVLCATLAAGAWAYLRAAFLATWARVPFILLLSIWPLQFVYGFLLSNHYFGVATEFASRGMNDGALDYYNKAIRTDPFVGAYHQYRAYILRVTKDLNRNYSPVKGDEKPVAGKQLLNDYERGLRDLNFMRKRAPNNALLYEAYGEFFYEYGVQYARWAAEEILPYQKQAYEALATDSIERAKIMFHRSLLLDPVNPTTYVFLTSIAMMERNPEQAQFWIDAYHQGPKEVTEPEFLQVHRHHPQLDQMEQQLRQPPYNYHPVEVFAAEN